MHSAFFMFFYMKVLNYILVYLQHILTRPIVTTTSTIPTHILPTLTNLLIYVYSVKKIGVTMSKLACTNFHPSLQGVIDLISMYR